MDQRRFILSPEERGRLLAIGARLQHEVKGLVTVVQFKTYQRWVKEQREGRKPGRVGRPRSIGKPLRDLIVRLAKENPGWGYLRIVGELIELRCPVEKTSVRRILKEEGLDPRPRPDRSGRPDFQPWDVFVKLHLNTLVACDFFCKNVWTLQGKPQAYALMFMHVGSRRVWVSPATYHPNGDWMLQQVRNVLMWLDEQGLEATYLIHDRDTKFTATFDQLLRATSVRVVKSPVRAPNANAFAESWIATVRRKCLDHFARFSLEHVDDLVQTCAGYYNQHRPHQGLGNRVLGQPCTTELKLAQDDASLVSIGCLSEVGGLLKRYYHRAA
ncbi:MAG: integrase core domain-containing protein [Planctomycetota bacterium]